MARPASDVIVGCGLLAFSAFAAWRSLNIGGRSIGTVAGPSFLPWIMIGAIVLLSLALIVRSRLAAAPAGAPDLPEAEPAPEDGSARRNLIRIGIFAVLLVAYSAAFMAVGYIISTLVVFIAGMLLMGERRPLMLIVLPVLITAAVWFGFTHFLQVWLP